ncbi:hypothetical protein ACWEOW_10215 [Monashia sp. NPDC004114]
MKVTITIDEGESPDRRAGDEGRRGGDTQAGMAFTGAPGDSGDVAAVPADLAARAAAIGALSAGPAPSADAVTAARGAAAGAPGFPPSQVGAPRPNGDNTPTSASADDISAGAAPGDSSHTSGVGS